MRLIPMGAARLRISAFPTDRQRSGGPRRWQEATDTRASASHCHEGDSVESHERRHHARQLQRSKVSPLHLVGPPWNGRMGAYHFAKARADFRRRSLLVRRHRAGQCRVPASWKLLYKDGEAWKPVENASGYGTRLDRFNRTAFRPVETKALRIEVQLQPGFFGGIHQWKLEE